MTAIWGLVLTSAVIGEFLLCGNPNPGAGAKEMRPKPGGKPPWAQMASKEAAMRTQTERHSAADAILPAWEADGAFDAWTLDELDDELDALRPAFTQSDDPGS